MAQLKLVCWLEIWSTIEAGILSPLICYAVYFIYKLDEDYYCGLDSQNVEVSVGFSVFESKNMHIVCLHTSPHDITKTIYDSPYNPSSPYLTDDCLDDEPLPQLRDND